MIRRFFCAFGLFIAGAASAGAADLVSPISTAHAPYTGLRTCADTPTPVIGLQSQPYYTDGAYSKVDPEAYAREQAAAKPLDDFLRVVQRAADEYRRGMRGQTNCALGTLAHWARAGALLGDFSLQGSYQRKWTMGGAALAYLSLGDEPAWPEERALIEKWFVDIAHAIQPYYDRKPSSPVSDKRNNHAYWAGLAVAAAGLAAHDRALVEWGVGKLRLGLADVTAAGALPAELARKSMALHYHLFSLPPLAALARIADVNGMALTAQERAALDKLASFTFAATQDPAEIARMVDAAQDDPMLRGRPALVQGTGLELWLVTKPGGPASEPAIDAALKAFRPYRMPWLGGDLAALWAPK